MLTNFNKLYNELMMEFKNQYFVSVPKILNKIVNDLKQDFEHPAKIDKDVKLYICSINRNNKIFDVVDNDSINNINVLLFLSNNHIEGKMGKREISTVNGNIDVILNINEKMLNEILVMKKKYSLEDLEKFNKVCESLKNTLTHELDHAAQDRFDSNIASEISYKYGDDYYTKCFVTFAQISGYKKVAKFFIDNKLTSQLVEFNTIMDKIATYYLNRFEISAYISGYKINNNGNDVVNKVIEFIENIFKKSSINFENEIVKDYVTDVLKMVAHYYADAMLLKYHKEEKNIKFIKVFGKLYYYKNRKFQ